MHKHRPYGNTSRRQFDANRRISAAASSTILSLLEGIGETDEPAAVYLREQYLSKYCDESLTPAIDRRNAAIDKWKRQEAVNRDTNTRLRGCDMGYNVMPRVTYSSFLKVARRIICQVLGPLNDSIVLGSYSGGASTSRRRTSSTPAEKFAGQADTTEGCGIFVDILYRQAPLLRQYGIFDYLREVEGAVLFTVPKKTDIDRCACKEPDFNMYLQKGVGRHIRSRLRRFGINLNDQSINRSLAQRGSLLGDLATLDLSSASDSITIGCVEALLPSDWFSYLNEIRSQKVVIGEDITVTEMFSSMGNGFTFELESLIFYALCRTISYFEGSRGIISVYGDDIILSSELFDIVVFVFGFFGFQINEDKSFASGPFRESCGGHYYNGVDITPFYLKRRPTHLTDVIRVANQFRRWALADPARHHVLPSTYTMWTQLANMVPKVLWGGRDYESDTQLVSPDAPNKRLVRLSGVKRIPPVGSYLHWHNSNWKRTWDPEEGFPASVATKLCRLRSAQPGAPYLKEMFYQELL